MKQTDSVYILHMQHPKFLVLDVMYQNRLSHARTCQQKLYYKVRNPHGTSLFSPSLLINNSTFPAQITEHCLNKYWLGCHPVVNFTFQYFCDIG